MLGFDNPSVGSVRIVLSPSGEEVVGKHRGLSLIVILHEGGDAVCRLLEVEVMEGDELRGLLGMQAAPATDTVPLPAAD